MNTPMLVSWAGHVTKEGQELAAWLNLNGVELPKPPDRSLLKPAALFLRSLSDAERSELWREYQASVHGVVALVENAEDRHAEAG